MNQAHSNGFRVIVLALVSATSATVSGQTYTISTFAGNGTAGYNGDNGPAASAQLNQPYGLAVDSAGDLYIADAANGRIRKVSNGVITTVAGNGTVGDGGNNGPATEAQLRSVIGIAVDFAGNLYIAENDAHRIRKVSGGVITTVAGNGTPGYSGDGGPAVGAQLNNPVYVTVDSAGNLYIADRLNNRVRKVSNGTVTTVAGTGTMGDSGDGGLATSAQLLNPWGLAFDSAGNLYIADLSNRRIRKVSNGIITTVAGNGIAGYSGDNGPATSAQLFNVHAIAVDSAGNLYIADNNNYRIRKVSNGVITTIAGNGISGYSGDNGPAVGARIGFVFGIASDALGRVYLSDSSSQRVRVLTLGASSCTYAVSTPDLGVAAAGGSISLSIQTGSDCSWSLAGLPTWLTASGSSQGSGPASVTLVASSNQGGARTGTFTVGGVAVPIRQLDAAACGGSSSCVVRSIPHLAFGGEWTTGLSAISSGTATGSFSVGFYGDNGASVALPFTGGLGGLSTLSDGVPAQGLKYYEAENPSTQVQAGWAMVVADSSVTVQAIFRRHTAAGKFYEAAVPAGKGYSTFVVPFDATTFAPVGVPMFTGLAINNLNPNASANLTCTARDQSDQIVPNAISIPPLNPMGHYSGYDYPALSGKRGTLSCTADTLVSAIALRFIGYEAFSTLPVIVK